MCTQKMSRKNVGEISTQKREVFSSRVDPATNVHVRRRETHGFCVRGFENAAPKEEGDFARRTTTTCCTRTFVVESVFVGDGVDKVAKRFRRL